MISIITDTMSLQINNIVTLSFIPGVVYMVRAWRQLPDGKYQYDLTRWP